MIALVLCRGKLINLGHLSEGITSASSQAENPNLNEDQLRSEGLMEAIVFICQFPRSPIKTS